MKWNRSTVNPSLTEVNAVLDEIERSSAGELHSVVKRHLRNPLAEDLVAFPRCEAHFDRYLYGLIHLPTSSTDHSDEMMELAFIATHEEVWSFLRCEGDQAPHMVHFCSEVEKLATDATGFETSGSLIGELLTLAIKELEDFLSETGKRITSTLDLLEIADSRNLSRFIKEEVPNIRSEAGSLRMEVESLTNVVDQMAFVLHEIVNDQIDLRPPESLESNQELFDRHTEISLSDTLYRARRLQGVMREQLRQLELIALTINHLRGEDEVTSGRFMAAVASIMLLPTFIAGLYGMNFEFMPELHWQAGYIFVILLIVGVSILQFRYFRRKRWI